MVDRGEYLWRCLRYIDLNMVRAGVVCDPAEWAWCGHGELTDRRRRYRVIDPTGCAAVLAPGHPVEVVARHYRETVAVALAQRALAREAVWTESIAVGGETFVRAMAERIRSRMAVETGQTADGLWCVREAGDPYSPFFGQKNGSKRQKS
jgi:putative transposase